MNELLNKLNLRRDQKNDLGKKMGNQIWFHKDYALIFISKNDYQGFKSALPESFDFNIIRYDSKKSEVAFIQSKDFDSSNEPVVGDSYKVIKTNNNFELQKITKKPKNPTIYHHKWMFVKDDYQGFNVEKSKLRSIEWKSVLGVNKTISSKIGRIKFWDEWLSENNLPSRID